MRHFKENKRKYIEAAIAVIAIAGLCLVYIAEENNIEGYLANTFSSQALRLGQVTAVNASTSEVTVAFLTGPDKGETTVTTEQPVSGSPSVNYVPYVTGEKVILAEDSLNGIPGQQYYITDRFRLPVLLFIVMLFVAVAILFGRIRGLTSIIGLGISILVLGWFVVPWILHGADPLTVCLAGAAMIALASLYLAHGFNKRTTVALCGTLITLVVSALLAVLFVNAARLMGFGTDVTFYLTIGTNTVLNLRGILLGGIIIGALGVLDDVTVGQAATVVELKDANPDLDFKELYRRGMTVGREHIASLINTLFLAYAGVALPVILYLVAFQSQIPLWLTINGEPIAEEVVRTMVGSMGIILAVPITTLIAARAFGHPQKDKKSAPSR